MAHSFSDIGRNFSPLQIGYIVDTVEPIDASASVEWVFENVKDNPELEAVPIERDGMVLGILSRQILEKLISSIWTKFWQKNLESYIIRSKDVIDATTYISGILKDALSQESYEAVWYVVQHRRSYLGIVSLKKILEYTNTLRNQDLFRAGEIQRHLLQKSIVRDKRFDLCVYNQMAHEIGGDFYRVYQPDKNHALVGCFDVAGKNISGALTTMALGACFSSFEMFQFVGTADKITSRINKMIKEVNPPGIFVAAVLFFVDFTTGFIRIHNCGFSQVLIFVPQSNNKITYKISNPTLPPLGIVDEYDYSDSQIIPITRGLRICTFSDGLTDIMNIYGERYGEAQAIKLVKDLHKTPLGSLKSIISKEIENFVGNASLADDVTLMDLRFY
ncbi:MAG: SpoIIE family protein phosphatase [Treponema sp.]|jgi:sigma-B regulation protein RsbU (phosphoserine phosphatase)|nr:SpoIIE family protein phosphatase [Treponema sp.]